MSYVSDIRALIGKTPLILVGVCGILTNEHGHILLQKRTDSKAWGLPGGLMELKETAEMTLRRELLEELAICITETKFFGIYTNRPIITYPNGDQSQPIGIFFTCTTDDTPSANDETFEIGYFSKEKLPENIFSIHREPILDYFDGRTDLIK
mgnify:FL=1